MNRRNFTWGAVFVALILLVLWLLRTPRLAPAGNRVASEPPTAGETPANAPRVPPPSPPSDSPQQVVQPPPHGATEAEKWKWWHEMGLKDRYFEYKMPIAFFGRVVDDRGNPVSGATIDLSWTDLSPKDGVGKRTVLSDDSGLFSLEGAVGKGLSVRVKKEGYKTYFTKNQFSFEYASFSDPKYHEPDPMKPVVFVLRKNREAEPLVVRENQEAELAPGQSKSFPIGPNGAAVTVERLPNTVEGPRGWAARVSAQDGGLALATEEFSFEAPKSGYEPSMEITAQTPRPPVWQGDNGAAFFVQTPQGYARITVRNTPGMSWVYVSSYFNPEPGSRNLEFDPAKMATGAKP